MSSTETLGRCGFFSGAVAVERRNCPRRRLIMGVPHSLTRSCLSSLSLSFPLRRIWSRRRRRRRARSRGAARSRRRGGGGGGRASREPRHVALRERAPHRTVRVLRVLHRHFRRVLRVEHAFLHGAPVVFGAARNLPEWRLRTRWLWRRCLAQRLRSLFRAALPRVLACACARRWPLASPLTDGTGRRMRRRSAKLAAT